MTASGVWTLVMLLLASCKGTHSYVEETIDSGGATFPAKLYNDLWRVYLQEGVEAKTRHGLAFHYKGLGSTMGNKWIMHELDPKLYPPVPFVGSTSLMTSQNYIDHPELQMFPMVAG